MHQKSPVFTETLTGSRVFTPVSPSLSHIPTTTSQFQVTSVDKPNGSGYSSFFQPLIRARPSHVSPGQELCFSPLSGSSPGGIGRSRLQFQATSRCPTSARLNKGIPGSDA